MKKISILIIMMLFMTACSVETTEANDRTELNTVDLGYVFISGAGTISVKRFIDTDFNNVCYIGIGNSKGGISCVSIT